MNSGLSHLVSIGGAPGGAGVLNGARSLELWGSTPRGGIGRAEQWGFVAPGDRDEQSEENRLEWE